MAIPLQSPWFQAPEAAGEQSSCCGLRPGSEALEDRDNRVSLRPPGDEDRQLDPQDGAQDACNWDEDFKEMGTDFSEANMEGYSFVGFLAAPHFGVAVELG